MSRRWADDPVFLARFVREAYAAAQLNHPNIVQIYDIGVVNGTHYFSMEYVPGRSLAEMLVAGKLDPETAVSHVLQAARGLKHAHDRGMIHRDIKPDNLLLSDQGIVKVADLGLVKTPKMTPAADSLDRVELFRKSSSCAVPKEMTGVRMALGTPAYMSPEQCRDAATVDHRADVYSLGCTLYALVTGRPPFDGDTAVELMTKQAYEAAIPPELVAARVPKELSAIIQRMMAKHPADRYQSMGEVVRVLEQWLGVHHAGTYSPREDHITALEHCVATYNHAAAVVLRERILSGFLSSCLLASMILMFFGRLDWAFGLAGLVIQSAAVYFVLAGLTGQSDLFRYVRRFVRGMTLGDWSVSVAGFILFGVFLWMLNLFWVWIGFGLIGAGLALGLRFGLDRAVDEERRMPLKHCRQLLRRMRIQGLDEEAIRQFVAKYSGRNWEEFFEALFGYDAKLAARALLLRGGYAGEREKYAAWREPIIAFLDRVEKTRQARRERDLLITTEQARLVANGLRKRTAWQQARQHADELLCKASAIRLAESRRKEVAAGVPISVPNVQGLIAVEPMARPESLSALDYLAWFFVGPHVRLVFASMLMTACALWAIQNGLIDVVIDANTAAKLKQLVWQSARTRPLELSGIPAEYTAWCDTANIGWAGVLLLASLFYHGNRMGLLVLVGAAVTVLGHRCGIQTVDPIRDYHVAMILGTVLCLVGYRFGRC
jgi:tRNA A-37 threonylcarbamoyl transferase component Bud32